MIYTADVVLPVTKPPIKNGAVLVKDGRVAGVGEKDTLIWENRGEEVRDFENAILMPGLVNLHGHLECSAFDFLAKPTSFSNWLDGIIRASRKMKKDNWLSAARLGVKRYLEAGITCTADISRSGAGLQALAERNMMGVVYLEAVGIDNSNLFNAVIELLELIKALESIAQWRGIKLGLSPHSPYTLSMPALKVCGEISREYGLPLSIHMAETWAEVEMIKSGTGPLALTMSKGLDLEVIKNGGVGKTPAEFLDGFGLVNSSLVAAHGVWLSSEDIELLKERNAVVAVCPTSNELLGAGKAPVDKFMKSGLMFGVATDSAASNPDLDMFLEIRKLQDILAKQTGRGVDQPTLSPETLIKMVTINAASMLGLSNELGSIESGKRADFIVIDFDEKPLASPHAADPYGYLVKNASKSHVRHTFLAGEAVYSL